MLSPVTDTGAFRISIIGRVRVEFISWSISKKFMLISWDSKFETLNLQSDALYSAGCAMEHGTLIIPTVSEIWYKYTV